MANESSIGKFIGLLDKILKFVALIGGGMTLICMTLLSVWNVLIMRKALNAPIIGAEDVMILLLVMIVTLSIPLGGRAGAHIEIEVLEPHMSEWFAEVVDDLCQTAGRCASFHNGLAPLARRAERSAILEKPLSNC